MKIGEKIKKLRKNLGLSQEELATRAGLTKGFISQLERDLTSPSIASLELILDALGTDMADFFKDSYISERLIKEGDYLKKSCDDFIEIHPLDDINKSSLDIFLMKIKPNKSGKSLKVLKGEEFIYVISGKIKIKVENKVYELEEGDGFYSKCNKNRKIINEGEDVAEVIIALGLA